jgi:hypothetical protein
VWHRYGEGERKTFSYGVKNGGQETATAINADDLHYRQNKRGTLKRVPLDFYDSIVVQAFLIGPILNLWAVKCLSPGNVTDFKGDLIGLFS